MHLDQPVLKAGPSLQKSGAALLLIHGRGASADSILSLSEELRAEQFSILAPQAAGNTWYPYSFLAPISANQPQLDSALELLEGLVKDILAQGVASDRIAILGFSQGACLTLEYVARQPRRYGAIIGLTGGLIGPPGTPRNYPGTLDGTPVFLGSGDPDPHVPFERVQQTQQVLERMGATVELRRYPGMPHSINQDELDVAGMLLKRIASSSGKHPD